MTPLHRRSLRWVATVTSIFAAAAGWSTLLWPPVRTYVAKGDGASLVETIAQLLKPVNSIYPDGIFVGWVFLLSTIALVIAFPLAVIRVLSAVMRYVERSEVDVSLLELNLTYRFSDRLESVVATREQIFHSNSSSITAYHYNQTTEAEGSRIDVGSFEMNSIVNGDRITDDFIIRSTPKNFEAIEIFKRPLPRSILATYLPDWLVLLMWNHGRLLDKAIVERGGEITIHGDHNGEDATVSLHSTKRIARRVTMKLDFPKAVAPSFPDIRCFIIRGNVVSGVHPRCHTEGDRRIYTAYAASLDHAVLRFQWNNRRLRDQTLALPIDPSSADPEPSPTSRLTRLWNRLRRV